MHCAAPPPRPMPAFGITGSEVVLAGSNRPPRLSRSCTPHRRSAALFLCLLDGRDRGASAPFPGPTSFSVVVTVLLTLIASGLFRPSRSAANLGHRRPSDQLQERPLRRAAPLPPPRPPTARPPEGAFPQATSRVVI